MDKGHCDQDRTHLANVTAGGRRRSSVTRRWGLLASNWRVTGIVSVRSGAWLNITTGADNALNGQLQQRPNQVSDDVYGAKTLNSYLNRAAFASAAPGTFGNLEYRAVEGPGYWAIDTAFSQADRSRRHAQHRAAARVVQPDEPLQLGQPRDQPQSVAVRTHHDQWRRAAHHAVRREIRLLGSSPNTYF